jgi:hypothetical protein
MEMRTPTLIHDCPNCGGHDIPIEDASTRELFELADGMRHWWNDDNPEADQLEAYDALAMGSTPEHDKYVGDLEAIVAVLYDRFEDGEIIGGQLG